MKTFLLVSLSLLAVTLLIASCSSARGGYETARYDVLRTDSAFEIRKYRELKVAATSNNADNGSFMRLFKYIEGANDKQEKLSMTTPVFMEAGEMRFVVPEKNKDVAPKPSSEKVEVKVMPARTVAVYRFTGRRSDKLEKEALEKLREWMKANKLESKGEPFFAYYDPPWTLGPFRRNEVLVPVEAK